MTSGIAGLLLARSLELSCCWQEGVAAVFRLFAVGAAGCVPPAQDCARAIASSSPDAPRAIAARSPGTPADTPRRWRPSADGNRYGVAVGRPNRCKRPEQAETWMAEMRAGNSRRLVLPMSLFSHATAPPLRSSPSLQASNLETHVKYVPRPRQWVCSFELQNRRKCCYFIPALTTSG